MSTVWGKGIPDDELTLESSILYSLGALNDSFDLGMIFFTKKKWVLLSYQDGMWCFCNEKTRFVEKSTFGELVEVLTDPKFRKKHRLRPLEKSIPHT